MTQRRQDLFAGGLAIGAGLCWFAWASANTVTGHRLEQAPTGSVAAMAAAWLTVGWNLLLIPAALRLRGHVGHAHDRTLVAATAAGVLSATLWALGGLSHNSHTLETAYLALAASWLVVLGLRAVRVSGPFGAFTLVVAAFTALDTIFNLLEPVPFAIYLLAAPKLPLAALWSITAGAFLLRRARA